MVGLLSAILVTGSLGYWVWGTTYNEVKADRDKWMATALEGLKVSRQVSTARLPVMAVPPQDKPMTAEQVKAQLGIVRRMNTNKEF